MSREAMQMALDAFDYFFPTEDGQLWHTANDVKKIDDARQALIDALADDGGYANDISQDHVDEKVKCKHEWVGLTDEEIQDLSYLSQKIDEGNAAWFDRLGFARAIEAKLKEKNT